MDYRHSKHGRSGESGAAPASATMLLALILLVGAALRFHHLDWGDQAWAHPDERAVASQTFDMMVRDDYRPTIHSWGHFGYYSTLFAYKTFLWCQHALNGDPSDAGARLTSVSGSAVPHFRGLVRGGRALPLALAIVAMGWVAIAARRRWLREPRRLAIAALVVAAAIAIMAPWIRARMLTPVDPDYDDVIFLGRFLSALCSTVSIALVYGIGARLYRRDVGLLAAAFLAVAVLPIQVAHFYIVDPVQTFAVLLAVWLAALLLRSGVADPQAVHGAATPVRPPWASMALYPLVGAAVGLALASKFSSLPLLALPLVVHVLAWDRVGRRAPLAAHSALVLAYIAALGTWFALQPYAWENAFTPFAEAAATPDLRGRWLEILFSRAFAEQILEQSLMVEGRAGGPWVQQFAGTIPFVSMTTQWVRFGLGWPLGLAAIAGFAWCVVLNLRRPRAEDLLLLSWAAPLFLTLGMLQATFSRYTAPLVPFLCLFAALLCLGRERRSAAPPADVRVFGRARRHAWTAAWTVALAGSLLYSVAFVRIYDAPHAWTYASLWIFRNVSPVRTDGQPVRIAHEDWDDSLPLRMPPYRSEVYGSVLMAPYEHDSEEKLHRWSQWLEQADWICLPTTRLYGTILGVPDRYPLTVNYYKALFAGRLGFTLRRTVREQPRLWPFTFDDFSGAEESHYVYDHPKAVIFEKTERLDREELMRRIRELPPAVESLTRKQLLLWRESTTEMVRNVARDPYLDDAVVTDTELDSLMRAEELDPAATGVLRAALEAGGTSAIEGVDSGAVRAIVASASARLDDGEIAHMRGRIESLPVTSAHRAGDLRRTAQAVLLDAAARDRLVTRLRFPVEGRLLPRNAVLAKLDRVPIGAGRPPLSEPEIAPREGRRVKVVAEGGKSGQLLAALAWIVAIELLGLAVLPWTLLVFSALPGTGYLLAKTFGWVLATYVCWMIVNLGWAELGAPAAWAALTLVATAAWAPPAARRRISKLLPSARLLMVSELLFVATFAGYALVRAYNPEIFWGEKAMDFSLLNAVLRGGTLPPYEPWFAGASLNYYYYGFVLVAFLTLLLGTASSIAFNLAVPAIAALSVLGAFAVGHALTRRIRWGLAAAALVGFVANLDLVRELTHGGGLLRGAGRPLWDSWWASSRALSEGLISEYPAWSWLFADLHAHVIATPLALLVIALAFAVFVDRSIEPMRSRQLRSATWGALALTLGAQLAANTWDFLAYCGVLVLALGAASLCAATPLARLTDDDRAVAVVAPSASGVSLRSRPAFEVLFVVAWTVVWPLVGRLHPYWLGLVANRPLGLALALCLVALGRLGDRPFQLLERAAAMAARLAREALLPVLVVAGAAAGLYLHFLVHFDTGETAIALNRDGFITAIHALRHFGLFALVSSLYVADSLARLRHGRARALLLVGGSALAAATLLFLPSMREASGVVLYAFLLLAIAIVGALRRDRLEQRFATVLLVCGWGLAMASESIVLGDRMNTVFKLYQAAWILLATGCAPALAAILDREIDPSTDRLEARRAFRLRPLPAMACVLVAGAIAVGAAGTWRGVVAVVTLGRKASDRPTLDGLDFLRHDPRDVELLETITWLNQTTRGPQVVAEAFTARGYDESTRIAQYTGLPILLGWRHHLSQRGRTAEQMALREADLRRLYTATDPVAVAEVCRRLGVRYVVVGDLERDLYGSVEERFAAMHFLREAFRSSAGGYFVYEVAALPPAALRSQSNPAM